MCSARTYRAVGGIFILFVILALLFEVLPQFKAFEVLELLVGLALFTTPLMIFSSMSTSGVAILAAILYLLIGFYYFWIGKKNKQPNKVVGASVIFFIINLIIVGIAVLTVTLSCAKQSPDCGQSMWAFIAPIVATQILALVILVIGLLMGTKKTKKHTKAKPKRKKKRK